MDKVTIEKQALNILRVLALEFPGILDGETNVSGAALTECLTQSIQEKEKLKEHLRVLVYGETNFR